MKTPATFSLESPDYRRHANYAPVSPDDALPPGLRHQTTPIYRLIRTVRARRGFGTIIHTLTTFTRNKKAAHKSAVHWVKASPRTIKFSTRVR